MARAHKGKPLQVLLTEEERSIVDHAASRVGAPTSTWIRALALEEARRIKRETAGEQIGTEKREA